MTEELPIKKTRKSRPKNWRRPITITIDPKQLEFIDKVTGAKEGLRSSWIRAAIARKIRCLKRKEMSDQDRANPDTE